MKDNTLHMAIDPGSHKMGVSFFTKEGKFLISQTFHAPQKDPATKRLYIIREKFSEFFNSNFPDCYVTVTVMEHLPPSQITPALPISPGAIVSVPRNVSRLTPECAIVTSVWKSVAKQLGCTKRDPKGIPSFREIPWEFPMPNSEDEADSIFMYLAYCWNHHGYCWLGENLRAKKEVKGKK